MMLALCGFINEEDTLSAPSSDECDPQSVEIQKPQSGQARPERLYEFVTALKQQARLATAVGKSPQLRAIASELFLGDISIEIEDDPEIEGRRYVVISVESDLPTAEVAKRRKEWYNMTNVLLGRECELVQLSVTVV